jgi:hypothetical protein
MHGDGFLGHHHAALFFNYLAVPFLLLTTDGLCEFIMDVCNPA